MSNHLTIVPGTLKLDQLRLVNAQATTISLDASCDAGIIAAAQAVAAVI